MSNADLDKFLGECPAHKKLPWKIGAMESGQVAIDSDDGKEVTGWVDPEDACLILNQQQCIEELEREVERLKTTPPDKREDLRCVVSDLCGQVREARAERDALQADRDEWKARAEFSYRQRDELNRLCEFNEKTMSALQADNARLREAMKEIRDDFDCDNDAHRYGATCRCCLAEKTLSATPEQSIARIRNQVRDECYNALQKVMVTDHSLRTYKRCLDAIHAMKEPE